MPRKYNYTKKTGRPPKKIEDLLPPGWQDLVLKLAAKGASDVEIRAEIMKYNGLKYSAVKEMWYALQKRESEFAETLKIAKIYCEAWWVEEARKRLKSRYFRDHTWLSNMKNRFGWRDRTEVEHNLTDGLLEKFNNLTTEELKGKLLAIIGK